MYFSRPSEDVWEQMRCRQVSRSVAVTCQSLKEWEQQNTLSPGLVTRSPQLTLYSRQVASAQRTSLCKDKQLEKNGTGKTEQGTHICVLFSETNNHSRQAWQNLDVEEDTKLDKVVLCRGPDSISSKHKSPVTKDNGTLAVTPEIGVQSREH